MLQSMVPQGACGGRAIALVAVLALGLMAGIADGAPPPVPEHRHQPIDLPSRPIVSRVKLPLTHPRRLTIDADGKLVIADWGSGKVFSVDAGGDGTVIADNLDEPAGLACDAEGNIYVSTHAHGVPEAGTIIRVNTMGEQSIFAAGLTGPTAIAFDPHGQLYVANFHDSSISRISADGQATQFAQGIPQPSAIAFDAAGSMYVTSSAAGAVFRVSSGGAVQSLAVDLSVPSDLGFDQEGHLIVANYAARELTYLQGNGNARRFATVPKGTIGFVFDRENNLVIANYDHPFVIRVTSHIDVPCPHCDKPIPVRLRGTLEPLDEKTIDERLF